MRPLSILIPSILILATQFVRWRPAWVLGFGGFDFEVAAAGGVGVGDFEFVFAGCGVEAVA